MRRWRSHKVVEAEPIRELYYIGQDTNPPQPDMESHWELEVGGAGQEPERVRVSRNWLDAQEAIARKRVASGELKGGYFVRYEDGYESWSPAQAFEGGYKETL